MSSIAPASGASGTSASSIGGNTAPSSGSSSMGKVIGGNTAPSSSRSFMPTSGGITYGQIRREKTTPIFDRVAEEKQLQELQANIMQQKMTAQMLKGFVANEEKAFSDWVSSMDLELNEIQDLEQFIDNFETNEWTNDEVVNSKIAKVAKFIPDIIEAISKKEGLGTALKIAEGESVVVDTAKYSIEKVIAPALKTLGGMIEKRFSNEMGKQVASALTKAGEKLAGLPSRVLGVIGPLDIATSILDMGLAIAAKASGSYRASHHNLPDWLESTPILGGIASAGQSIRDLIDTAGGVPTNEEGAEQIRETLQNDLWKPMMNEYDTIIGNIAGKADEVELQKEQISSQMKRLPVQEEVASSIDGVVDLLGRDVEAIKDQYIDNLGLEFNEDLLTAGSYRDEIGGITEDIATIQNSIRDDTATLKRLREEFAPSRTTSGIESRLEGNKEKLVELKKELATANRNYDLAIENDALREAVNDIETIAMRELGLVNDIQAEESLVDVDTPELLEEVVSPAELEGRLLLDNMFSLRDQLELANGQIKHLENEIRKAEQSINQSSTILSMRDVPPETIFMADRVLQQARADKMRQSAELAKTEDIIPNLETSIDSLQGELETQLEHAEEQGIDLSFMEASTNFDEALAVIQDDRKLWSDIFERVGYAMRGFDYI